MIAELSNRYNRGKLISLQSILWGGLGGIAAVMVALPLLNVMGDEFWRVLLGLGMVPPLVVLALRRSINESWVWQIKRVRGEDARLRNRGKYALTLFFTALSLFTWTFILAIFANYTPAILVSVMGLSKAMALLISGLQWISFVIGGLVVFRCCDQFGRRKLIIPTGIITAVLLCLSSMIIKSPLALSIVLLILWVLGGIGYIVSSIYSSELFPTLLRGGTSSGINFSSGRLGGYLSTLILPSLLLSIGLSKLFIVLAVIMIPLIIISIVVAPSSESKDLDELEKDYLS